MTALKLKCVLIPPQLIKHAVRYVDSASGEIEVIATAHDIESKTTSPCQNKGGVGENQIHLNGGYTGNFTISGASLTTNATP